MSPVLTDIWGAIYLYLIYYHPVYYFYRLGQRYNPDNIEEGVWMVVAIFGIAVWFALARLLAETPGRQFGNMIIWWGIIAAFHIFAIPIYLIYAVIDSTLGTHWKNEKARKFGDRSPSEIRSGIRGDRNPTSHIRSYKRK